MRQGLLERADNAVIGVELIEAVDTRAVAIPGQEQPLHFAIDRRNIAFARVEGNRIYPIDTTQAESLIRVAEHFEGCSRSFWKRRRHEGFERQFGSTFIDMTMALERTSDTCAQIIYDLDKTKPSA